jgi:protein involved in temperature-dependent protein secretion
MFGFGKTKNGNKQTAKRPGATGAPAAVGQGSLRGKNQANGQGLAGDALRAQALAHAKAARAHIGDETLDKIAAVMARKQNSAMEQARRNIAQADAERVAIEILSMIETKH